MSGLVRKQCKACPWRKDVAPDRDIPNGYCAVKHAALKSTIDDGSLRLVGPLRMMACHEFPVGAEQPCVGWMANQLGRGNNIRLRFALMEGRLPRFALVGEQHDRFEDTLP